MHPTMTAAFSAYVLRAILASSSMPPLMARLLYAGALLIAVPIALITFLLTLLASAGLLLTAWLRRGEPRTDREPGVIDAEYTVVDEPDGRAAPRRRVAADR